ARRQQGDGGGVFGDSQFTSTLSVNFHFPKIPRRTFFTPANRARWGRYFNTLMLLYESAPHLSLIYQREANDHAEFNISTTLFQG
ncbi:hypothetical protein, partial [Aeromonas caviae]|uniref:hypothetical protein n=1 Tax=Aeromonas caviae TaxID=648 RepID=UPI001CC5D40C